MNKPSKRVYKIVIGGEVVKEYSTEVWSAYEINDKFKEYWDEVTIVSNKAYAFIAGYHKALHNVIDHEGKMPPTLIDNLPQVVEEIVYYE